MIVSRMRFRTMSSQPPQYPAAAPRIEPTTKDIATASTDIVRSSRVATITREKTSRPI